jgi:hypothetical protein
MFTAHARRGNVAKLLCEKVSDGLRALEAIASVRDLGNRRHFIRVERDFLTDLAAGLYLPVGIVHVDLRTKVVLVELPHEAETGANRLCVNPDQLDEPVEAFA